jgi:hypothetical protein
MLNTPMAHLVVCERRCRVSNKRAFDVRNLVVVCVYVNTHPCKCITLAQPGPRNTCSACMIRNERTSLPV